MSKSEKKTPNKPQTRRCSKSVKKLLANLLSSERSSKESQRRIGGLHKVRPRRKVRPHPAYK